MLLRRQEMPRGEAIERLVGMQARGPLSPYLDLWARLNGFRQEELAGAITGRTAVRMPLLRSTIHLVTARDCLALRPVLNPVLERNLYVGSPYGRQIAGMDIEALLAAGRDLLEERPRTSAELGKVLAELWPGRDEGAMAYALHNLVPVVQVPPRGVWGAGGLARWTTVEAWLGRPIDTDPAPDKMVLRYLASPGPATAVDASEGMLAHSRRLNPSVTHKVGDMRNVRLGEKFAAVLIHDAISYMLSEADLRAAIATAAAHLGPGGVLVMTPDHFLDTFQGPVVDHRTHFAEGVQLTYVYYSYDPDPTDTTMETLYSYFILRGSQLRIEHDSHITSLSPRSTWVRLITEAGFSFEKRSHHLIKEDADYPLLIGRLPVS